MSSLSNSVEGEPSSLAGVESMLPGRGNLSRCAEYPAGLDNHHGVVTGGNLRQYLGTLTA